MNQTNIQNGPTVGQVLTDKHFDISQSLLDDYFEGLEIDRGPFERGEQPVPSMIAIAADSYFAESAYAQQRGHLWMRQQWRFVEPLRPGETYVTHAHIADIYKRRNRTLVNTEVQVVDQSGSEALTLNHHQSFLLDAPVDQVQFREPAKKEGVRKFVVPQGDRVEGFDRVITLEMCGQYFHGNKSYHTDLEASKELGFQEVVVGGAMTMSYIGHLLDGYFGDRWFRGGELEVKFTNPAWPNDHISIKGVSTGPSPDDPSRESVFAWVEKDDGTIVMIANASAPR